MERLRKLSEAEYNLENPESNEFLVKTVETEGGEIFLDLSRNLLNIEVYEALLEFAQDRELLEKIQQLKNAEILNQSENRRVGHHLLRAPKNDPTGKEILRVLEEVCNFSTDVRASKRLSVTNKKFTQILLVGIGGSSLSVEFMYESLRSCVRQYSKMRFLCNVDPANMKMCLDDLDLEQTLVVVVSKSFTTQETLVNASRLKTRFLEEFGPEVIERHFVACTQEKKKAEDFGIAKVFPYWDFVGGRFSVTSSAGILPLSLAFGFDLIQEFLEGAKHMDRHFFETPVENNLPCLLSLVQVWNFTFLKHSAQCLVPYSQALSRFTAHVQQLEMESNGKQVSSSGTPIECRTQPVVFGEPGTNAQHSFFQFLHQSQDVCPADFIGFCRNELSDDVFHGTLVHDELMSNFFAQIEALTRGQVSQDPNQSFPGNRPVNVLLLPEVSPYFLGSLLSLYEAKTCCVGFLLGLNSFDQPGVELGKSLAKEIRDDLSSQEPTERSALFSFYLRHRQRI